jgi:hypothetical protein
MTQAQAIGVIALTEQNTVLPAEGRPGPGYWNHALVRADRLFSGMSHELLLLSGRGGGR